MPSATGRVTRAHDPASRPAPAFVEKPRAPGDTLNLTRTQSPFLRQMRQAGRQREWAACVDPGGLSPSGEAGTARRRERKARVRAKAAARSQ